MQSDEIRSRFLKFFEKRGHKIIPSSSLVPLIRQYYLQLLECNNLNHIIQHRQCFTDFDSKNTTSSQKCIRTVDIDEVGDATHLTFFEMLGNFSLAVW